MQHKENKSFCSSCVWLCQVRTLCFKHKEKRKSAIFFTVSRRYSTEINAILRMPACICVCCGRPRYSYSLACAYVLVPCENQPLTKLPPINTEWDRYCSFQRVWNSRWQDDRNRRSFHWAELQLGTFSPSGSSLGTRWIGHSSQGWLSLYNTQTHWRRWGHSWGGKKSSKESDRYFMKSSQSCVIFFVSNELMARLKTICCCSWLQQNREFSSQIQLTLWCKHLTIRFQNKSVNKDLQAALTFWCVPLICPVISGKVKQSSIIWFINMASPLPLYRLKA